MVEHTVAAAAGPLLAQSRERLSAAQAPQFIAKRELELLQAADRDQHQHRYGVRHILARVGARLVGGTSAPAATS